MDKQIDKYSHMDKQINKYPHLDKQINGLMESQTVN